MEINNSSPICLLNLRTSGSINPKISSLAYLKNEKKNKIFVIGTRGNEIYRNIDNNFELVLESHSEGEL